MKLLRDARFYCIMVDYLCWSEERGEYKQPCYLGIDTETVNKKGESMNLIVFDEEITDRLRIFDTREEAETYLAAKGASSCCYDNGRVAVIDYDFEERAWI